MLHARDNNENSISAFQEFLLDQAFPCVGAKSALGRHQMEYCLADDIRTADNDREITKKLQKFALRCTPQSLFVSFAVIFQNASDLNEVEFERYLWQRLQSIHEIDAVNYDWDPEVSSDPESPHFSMSIGGKGFYIVGLHPASSRAARRFTRPALVFNLHSQFERLREEGRYGRIRETILARDEKLCGTLNPMLAEHGQSSEARQYSGRKTDDSWKCPFHASQRAGK